MTELPESAKLYLDSNRGMYIPQHFFEETKPECINWHHLVDNKDEYIQDCSDVDADFHNDAWCDVLDNVTLTDPSNGIEYSLYQDGDLWLVPVDAEWPES